MKKTFFLKSLLIFIALNSCVKEPTSVEINKFAWPLSAPELQGMNSQLLDSARLAADNQGFVGGLLVIRNGIIVTEQYYNQYGINRPHNIKSVSKSVLSAITGIARAQGFVPDLEKKILDYFPEYITPEMDERKFDIIIRHLLTMQMGIDSESSNGYELYHKIYISKNWIKATLELPLIFNPGESMCYNTFQTHLLSAILSKSVRQNLREYAAEHLFSLMGIDIDDWEQNPQGYYFGGNSMYFTAREMAFLGLLYLNSDC